MVNLFAQSALYVWLPVVMIMFLFLPPKRAVISAFIFGWLALPNIRISLPGIPDYSKMTATVFGVVLCLLLFNASRLFSVRFRWFDVPIVVWCLAPFASAITNDLGAYEGLSAILEQLMGWGLPYLIGRLYLTDLDSIRELCLGIVIGGLVYVPLCLFEMRMSPIIQSTVYGYSSWEGERYGGYRPKVFLQHGLECGLWMCNATLLGYILWSSKTVRMIRGFNFTWLLVALAITTILCRSTGSTIQMLMGLGCLLVARFTKHSWAIWLLIAIPPAYTIGRTTGVWSGRQVVEISKATIGEDRAQSYEYRLDMEDRLTARAIERPIFGWGRGGRSNVSNKEGNQETIQDGFWIITLGVGGIVNLVTLQTLMLLPMILAISRYPVKTWNDPRVAPSIALSTILVLTMIDFLSNGMINPILAVAIGGLVGQPRVQLTSGRREAADGLTLASDLIGEGQVAEAADRFHRVIGLVSDGEDVEGRQIQARALDGLGHSLIMLGRPDEAEGAFKDGLMIRDWLAAQTPDAERFQDLAIAREGLARLLVEVGRSTEAVEERKIALEIWNSLTRDHHRNAEYRGHKIESLNDLAWLLATDPAVFDPDLALGLAEEAARIAGDHKAPWNTVGVARYRMGDWAGAIEALERSALSSLDGLGTAWDHYYLAMAWCRLQHEDQAREWIERGVAWTARHRPGYPPLERTREEAESLLNSESSEGGGTELARI